MQTREKKRVFRRIAFVLGVFPRLGRQPRIDSWPAGERPMIISIESRALWRRKVKKERKKERKKGRGTRVE